MKNTLTLGALLTAATAVFGQGQGSLDTTYRAAADGQVNTLALQADGKVVIGGVFSAVNGTARNQFARLNADGTVDAAFDSPLARPVTGTHAVTATVLQPDGRFLVAGIPGQTQSNPSDPAFLRSH